MNVSANISAMNAAAYSFNVSANNVANLSTEGFQADEVVKVSGNSGPMVVVKKTDRPPEIVDEMVNQMRQTYDFKANAKVIKMHDEMIGTMINTIA